MKTTFKSAVENEKTENIVLIIKFVVLISTIMAYKTGKQKKRRSLGCKSKFVREYYRKEYIKQTCPLVCQRYV